MASFFSHHYLSTLDNILSTFRLMFVNFSVFKYSYFYMLKCSAQSKLKLPSKSFHQSKLSFFFHLQPDTGSQAWSGGRVCSVLSLFLCHISSISSLALRFFQVNIGKWDQRKCGKIISFVVGCSMPFPMTDVEMLFLLWGALRAL